MVHYMCMYIAVVDKFRGRKLGPVQNFMLCRSKKKKQCTVGSFPQKFSRFKFLTK